MVCAALLCVCAPIAPAHEHWLDADCFYPEAGQTVTVHVCSGHYFPKSSFALTDKVLERVTRRSPGNETAAVETVTGKKQRTGVLALTAEGTYILDFSLKRPRAREPSYEGKAILVVGDRSDHTNRYATGAGLELVPEMPISALRQGDELPVSVRLDGKRVSASVSVTAEGGKTSRLTAGPDRPASLRLRKAGRYLVTAGHGGRGCSLVFRVEE